MPGKETIKEVPKVWGKELWIVNNDKYCGKKLLLKKGYRCSIHQHKLKDETFYIQSGKVLMEYGKAGEEKQILKAGDAVHITQLLWHRFTGLEDAEIYEFSTQHFDSDSYRAVDSGKVDLKTVKLPKE